MQHNFELAFGRTLRHEGGWVNDPDDNGGETNYGITHTTYDAYRKRKGLAKQSVRFITMQEVREIKKTQYWDKVNGDRLPAAIDFLAYDYAIHSGVVKASKDLQRSLGFTGKDVDGIIGLNTIAAVSKANLSKLVEDYSARRLTFLRGLADWPKYKIGWTKRIQENIELALGDLGGVVKQPAMDFEANEDAAKAEVSDTKEITWYAELIKDPVSAIPVLGTAFQTFADIEGPISYAIAAVIIGGALWMGIRALKKDPV